MPTWVRTFKLLVFAGVVVLAAACGRRETPPPSPTPLSPTSSPTPSPTATPLPPSPTHTPTATPLPPSPTLAAAATPTPAATTGPLLAIVGDVLRVRGGPGTGYDILGRLQPGTQVALLARSADGGWFQIAYPAGTDQTGWLSAEFLQLQGSPDQVPVAQAPPTPSPTPTLASLSSTPVSTATLGATGVVSDVLRVRGGPGTGYDILGRLQPGTQVALLARSADGGWFQIAYPAGTDQTGWVNAGFLQLQGSSDQVPVAQAPPTPTPQPAPQPAPGGAPNPTLLNGSFDDYQPYLRDGEPLFWQEPEFPERYGADWTLVVISELDRRAHLMDSEVFGKFTQKYFGGGGRDYHIHGRHSQVIASRSAFDMVLMQTVTAQPGQEYTFSGSIVSFYQGTSGAPVHDKVFKTLGIDPTGGRDYTSPTVIWGERDGRDNEWRYPVLRATASSDAITLFIRLENTEPDVGVTELNVIHLDDFKLEP